MTEVTRDELYEFRNLCRKDRQEGLTSEEQERYDYIMNKAYRHLDEVKTSDKARETNT